MKDKTVAGLFALFLGVLGIHWFYLGRIGRGVLYLILTVLLWWTVWELVILGIINLIEGIILLCKDQDEFDLIYNKGRSNFYHSPNNQVNPLQSSYSFSQFSQQVSQNKVKNKGKAEQLLELKALLDKGILTQEEFDNEKKKILNS
ncbi:NINE protein [uncultured Prevotella sp.]|mgnify:FL=1|jgi:TM2 domain-containing membrane protein YozV|uniref:NINE protein n=1 Tax=uncultured Prevotella sp. TaxID=159272 RepID=UPI0026370835|nr:NINE protein [uncultured Prevotella sp.]